MLKKAWLIAVLLISCTKSPETIFVYEEEEPQPSVTVSVARWSTIHRDGDPYVTASGKVKNQGPGSVWNVRVIVSTNYGSTSLVLSSPSSLDEGDIGSWSVVALYGTYIQSKAVLFDY